MSLGRRTTNYRGYLTETTFDVARDEFVEFGASARASNRCAAAGGGRPDPPRPAADRGAPPCRARQSPRLPLQPRRAITGAAGLRRLPDQQPRRSLRRVALRLRGLRHRARGRRLADGPLGVRDPRRLLGLGRRQRHRGQPLGALPGARGFPGGPADLQPRGALLDPEGRPHPAARGDAGRLHARRRDRSRRARGGARSAPRRAGDRGAHLRDDGPRRARRHRRRPRPPRCVRLRSRAPFRPRRRRAERDGAALRRRRPGRAPPELPPRDRQHLDLGPQDDRHPDAVRRAGRPAAARRPGRVGDRLPPLERHDADGLAQRPRRARALGPAATATASTAIAPTSAAASPAPTGWPRRCAPPPSRCCATRSRSPWCSRSRRSRSSGRYQLACHRGEAHAIVMPNVTDTLLVRFLADYLGWWRSAPRSAVDGSGSAEPARARYRA